MTSSGLTQRKRNFQTDQSENDFTCDNSGKTNSLSSLPVEEDDEKKAKQLTLMEQVLLLGLKDSQVYNFYLPLIKNKLSRERCLFGMTTFPMFLEVVF